MNMHFDFLLDAEKPWMLCTDCEFSVFLYSISEWIRNHQNCTTFHVYGDRVIDPESCFSEIKRAFSFPDYFGNNLNAVRDCLTDDNIMRGDAFIVVISDAELLLQHIGYDSMNGLLDAFVFAGNEWARPVNVGEPWDRPAKPFHTILQCKNPEFFLQHPEIKFLQTGQSNLSS
jgi:hypothetical protein